MAEHGRAALEFLKERRDSILEQWVRTQAEDSRVRSDRLSPEEVRQQSAVLLDALVAAMEAAGGVGPELAREDRLQRPLREASLRRERLGVPPLATASWIMMLKDFWILPMLGDAAAEASLQEEARQATRLVDTLALGTYENLVASREETIRQQADELLEISTPVIRVWEGVVAAPLIGALDSERTQRFMERLLETIASTNSPVALVDITGVPTIDTRTAQHLIDTVSAVRLLGSKVILTGVRPSIAQTLVHLGISMSDIITRSSFAGGLRVAMDMLDLEVTVSGEGREA